LTSISTSPWIQQEVFAAEEISTGEIIPLPLIAPRPGAADEVPTGGSSSFRLADDTRQEVMMVVPAWLADDICESSSSTVLKAVADKPVQ
jgi:hypothetical protein